MTTTKELLPCPFCGGEASVRVLEYDDDCKVWGVFCESDLESEYGHGHLVDNYPTESEAIEAWNTRYEPTWGDFAKLLGDVKVVYVDKPDYTRLNVCEEYIGWLGEDYEVNLDQAQPIVRCRDCKHAYKANGDKLNCTGPLTTGWDYYNDEPQKNLVDPDGFCSLGERRDDEG